MASDIHSCVMEYFH